MSLKERKNAVKIIQDAIERTYGNYVHDYSAANYILNQLLRAGYLNDKVSVTMSEALDDLDKAIFKCKVEE